MVSIMRQFLSNLIGAKVKVRIYSIYITGILQVSEDPSKHGSIYQVQQGHITISFKPHDVDQTYISSNDYPTIILKGDDDDDV